MNRTDLTCLLLSSTLTKPLVTGPRGHQEAAEVCRVGHRGVWVRWAPGGGQTEEARVGPWRVQSRS